MRPPAAPPPRRGSVVRLLVGVMLIAVAVGGTVAGFLRLTTVLDAGGYGTPAMRGALVLLGGAGAGLAAGIALLIWDISDRYRPEP